MTLRTSLIRNLNYKLITPSLLVSKCTCSTLSMMIVYKSIETLFMTVSY